MLNRRQIRIKVMQSLYASTVGGDYDLSAGEKQLIKNVDKMHELYVRALSIYTELRTFSENFADFSKTKHLPTQDDLNPKLTFSNNPILMELSENRSFLTAAAEYRISWAEDQDIIRKLYLEFKKTDEYIAYSQKDEPSLNDHKELLLFLTTSIIEPSPLLHAHFENLNMHWSDDTYTIFLLIRRTFENIKDLPCDFIQPLYKNNDDKNFMIELFRKSLLAFEANKKLIAETASNWEIERIAVVDYLLMNMAIIEILNFPSIPVKVSMNEYIDISKQYSSIKSKAFINGILDKIVTKMKEDNTIKKTGRGLIDN